MHMYIIIKMTFDRIECCVENYSMLYFFVMEVLLKTVARGVCIEMTHVSLLSSMSSSFRIIKPDDIFRIFYTLPITEN